VITLNRVALKTQRQKVCIRNENETGSDVTQLILFPAQSPFVAGSVSLMHGRFCVFLTWL